MINLTLLRLLNTVSYRGAHYRVVQLSEDHVSLVNETGDYTGPLVEEDIEGIALTPELLVQSGIVYSGGTNEYQFILNNDAVLTVNPHIAGGHSVQLCVKGHWCGRPVQTLHELENLYLDLTGKEMAMD